VSSAGTPADRGLAPIPGARAAAVLVFVSSIAAGVLAIARDLRVAFREAGPSNVPASIRTQLDVLERTVPSGEPVLLVAVSLTEELWYARLVQRLLYPRHAAIIRYLPLTRTDADALRRRWGIRWVLAMGPSPPDVGFADRTDLGTLPGVDHRVWLGSLPPP
jgi:hypothetical protein